MSIAPAWRITIPKRKSGSEAFSLFPRFSFAPEKLFNCASHQRPLARKGSDRPGNRGLREQPEPGYTLEADGEHGYRVGEQGLLVHQMSQGNPPTQPNPAPGVLPGGFVLQTDVYPHWLATHPSDPTKYKLDAEVDSGVLGFTIKTPNGGMGVGTRLFAAMWASFGSQIKGIRGSWVQGDPANPDANLDTNLKQFIAAYVKYRAAGMSVMDAQRRAALDDTWTGKRAKGVGFKTVTIESAIGPDAKWFTVEVLFTP
jgi:hypothetical protein